jgi:predicted esterase
MLGSKIGDSEATLESGPEGSPMVGWKSLCRPSRILVLGIGLLGSRRMLASDQAEIRWETLTSAGQTRTYWLFVPDSKTPDSKTGAPRPLLVLLHGSGGNGERMVKPWKDLASMEGLVLAAPDSADSAHWASPVDGPNLLRDVVTAVAAITPIDPKRVYLFGHSAGAVFALQMAAFESEYFAAVAIHAGSLHSGYFTTFDWAKRKIPYSIWIGTRDAFFPIEEVRATRDALKARGFPVEYTEVPGHTHDYARSAKEINAAAWAFFQVNPLPGDPKFSAYGDSK